MVGAASASGTVAITASLVEILLFARKRHYAMNNTGVLPSIATLTNIALPERPDSLCNCNAAVAASFTACCTPSSQPAAPPGSCAAAYTDTVESVLETAATKVLS